MGVCMWLNFFMFDQCNLIVIAEVENLILETEFWMWKIINLVCWGGGGVALSLSVKKFGFYGLGFTYLGFDY